MDPYRISGVFVAWDGDLEMNVNLTITDGNITIRSYRDKVERTIHAQKPAALAFVDTLAEELHRTAKTKGDNQ